MSIEECLTWIADRKGAIEVYADRFAMQNLRVRFDTKSIEYGFVVAIGSRSSDGTPHTAATAIIECVSVLKKDE